MKNIDEITNSVKELIEFIRNPCGKQECPTCGDSHGRYY